MKAIKTENISGFVIDKNRYDFIFHNGNKMVFKLYKFDHPLLAISWFNQKINKKWTSCLIIDNFKNIKFYYENPFSIDKD